MCKYCNRILHETDKTAILCDMHTTANGSHHTCYPHDSRLGSILLPLPQAGRRGSLLLIIKGGVAYSPLCMCIVAFSWSRSSLLFMKETLMYYLRRGISALVFWFNRHAVDNNGIVKAQCFQELALMIALRTIGSFSSASFACLTVNFPVPSRIATGRIVHF